jgi:hypothetical protein
MLLDDAMAAAETATGHSWPDSDLKSVVKREIEFLKSNKWLIEGDPIKGSQFRRGKTLRVDWSRTPWADEHQSSVTQQGSSAKN